MMVAALFASSSIHQRSVDAAFSIESAARTHLSSIRNHIESSHSALFSGIRSIHYHSESFDDCRSAFFSRSVYNVRGCLSYNGAASFDTNCAADLNSDKCTLDILAAMALYPNPNPENNNNNNNNNNDPFSLPKSCLLIPATPSTAFACQQELAVVGVPIIIPTVCRYPVTINPTTQPTNDINACTIALKEAIIPAITAKKQTETGKCFDAILSYSLNVNATCTPVMIQLERIPYSNAVDSIISHQCSIMDTTQFSACKAAIASISQAQAACPNYNLGQLKVSSASILSVIDGGMAVLCVKDDTDSSKYCLSGVLSKYTTMTIGWDPATKVTDTLLNGMCRSCMKTVIDGIASLGGSVNIMDAEPSNANANNANIVLQTLWNSVNAISILCTTDPTNPSSYCAKIFPSIQSLSDYAEYGTIPSNDAFTGICSPCMNAILAQSDANSFRVSQLFPGAASNLRTMQSTVCQKDNKGNYCLPSVYQQLPVLAQAFEACNPNNNNNNNNNQCPAACSYAVQDLYSTKCCFASIGLRSILPVVLSAPSLSPYYSRFANAVTCNINPSSGKRCKTEDLEEIVFSISFANIDYWVLNKTVSIENSLRNSLRSDLALVLGIIDTSRIIIGSFLPYQDPKTNGGTKVSFTIKIEPSLKAAFINTVNGKLKTVGGLPLRGTANIASQNDALVVDGEPVIASGEGASSISSAFTIYHRFSFAVVIIAVVNAVAGFVGAN